MGIPRGNPGDESAQIQGNLDLAVVAILSQARFAKKSRKVQRLDGQDLSSAADGQEKVQTTNG